MIVSIKKDASTYVLKESETRIQKFAFSVELFRKVHSLSGPFLLNATLRHRKRDQNESSRKLDIKNFWTPKSRFRVKKHLFRQWPFWPKKLFFYRDSFWGVPISLLGYFCTYFHVVAKDFSETFFFDRFRKLSPASYMTDSKPSMVEDKNKTFIAFFEVHMVQPNPTHVTEHVCTQ